MCELLISIPTTRLQVEVGGLDLPNVGRGHRSWWRRHDGVTVVLAPHEYILGRQTFSKLIRLVVGVHDARASLGDFLRCDEICAEDGLREAVVGHLRSELRDADSHIVQPLVPATEEPMKAILVGIRDSECLSSRAVQ